MLKKTVLASILAVFSCSSFANVVVGVNYTDIAIEDGALELNLGGVSASLGYKAPLNDNVYIIPEVRYGTGITDDSFSTYGFHFDVELDSFLALSVRGQFELDSNIYLFAAPTYIKIEKSFTGNGIILAGSVDDSWELGVGAGLGYNFTEMISAELTYETIDGAELSSIGFRFHF